MPVPEAYDACRVTAPIVSASCGVPVTATSSLKTTCNLIVSPIPYESPTPGRLTIEPPVTSGALPPCRPSTVWPEAAVIAWLPSPKAALAPALLRIAPPFSVSALAATPIPSPSRSDWPTV